jgi:peptidoglycan hydrolase CwlO-like protein
MTFIIKANTTDLDRFSKELSEIQDEMRSLRAEMIETSKYVYNLNMELDKIKKKLEE